MHLDVYKRQLIRLTVAPDKEGRILNLKESSFCKLMYIVFFHHGLCVVLAYRIKVTSDLIHHLNDRDVCISVCEEFHNIKTYSTAAYDNDFFAFQILWKIINVVDHTKNRINTVSYTHLILTGTGENIRWLQGENAGGKKKWNRELKEQLVYSR